VSALKLTQPQLFNIFKDPPTPCRLHTAGHDTFWVESSFNLITWVLYLFENHYFVSINIFLQHLMLHLLDTHFGGGRKCIVAIAVRRGCLN